MANPTFTLIASGTVGSGGASSIDFTSIPATYTDLFLYVSLRSTTSDPDSSIVFNDSTSNRKEISLYGNGSAAASSSDTIFDMGNNRSTYTANTFSNASFYIPNYASSNYKSGSIDFVSESNDAAVYMWMNSTLWSDTSAINKITVKGYSSNLAQYSSAYLYGIKNS